MISARTMGRLPYPGRSVRKMLLRVGLDLCIEALAQEINDGALKAAVHGSLEPPGVCWRVRRGAGYRRGDRHYHKRGICGQHGGDTEPTESDQIAGLEGEGCAPHRVPIASVAAAKAALSHLRANTDAAFS